MKAFECKALGLEEMTCQEMNATEGGSVTLVILALAALAATVTMCQVNVGGEHTTVYVENSDSVSVKTGDTKTGGTDVPVSVSLTPSM